MLMMPAADGYTGHQYLAKVSGRMRRAGAFSSNGYRGDYVREIAWDIHINTNNDYRRRWSWC